MTTGGVGIDVVDVARFSAVLARRPQLAARLFTAAERHEAGGRSESLAARFAAKEATWKALGLGLGAVRLHDVEVRRPPGGRPTLHLVGRAADYARARGIGPLHLSLSHTDTVAAAVVVGDRA